MTYNSNKRFSSPTAVQEKIWEQIVQHTALIYGIQITDFYNFTRRDRNLSACRREAWWKGNNAQISIFKLAIMCDVNIESVRFGIAKYKAEVLNERSNHFTHREQKRRSAALKSYHHRKNNTAFAKTSSNP